MSSVWATDIPPGTAAVRVLPDAAVDLVLAGGSLVVAGPDTVACVESLPAGTVLGLQLHPRAVPAVLGVPATAVRDERTPIAELWGTAGRDLVDALGSAVGPREAATLIERACSHRMRGAQFVTAMGDLRRLVRPDRDPDLRALGLSERQLRRNCSAAHGYGPQMLRRIVRFQAVLGLLGQPRVPPLAEVAHRTGHVDQAHLAHEVGAFSGLTPGALRRLLDPSSRATNVGTGPGASELRAVTDG